MVLGLKILLRSFFSEDFILLQGTRHPEILNLTSEAHENPENLNLVTNESLQEPWALNPGIKAYENLKPIAKTPATGLPHACRGGEEKDAGPTLGLTGLWV